jgi:hypothetical protein
MYIYREGLVSEKSYARSMQRFEIKRKLCNKNTRKLYK